MSQPRATLSFWTEPGCGLYGSEARLGRLIMGELLERAGHQARVGIADGRYAALLAAMRGDIDRGAPSPQPPPLREVPSLSRAREGGEGAPGRYQHCGSWD